MATRKGISKRIRFEVFKRDSFKCQYCGKSAPDVILHVDHTSPASKGGVADLLNLITACADCNLGKSDKELSDDSAITKQRQQLEELNLRREQLEMLLKWREGLIALNEGAVEAVCEEWSRVAKGWGLNDNGKQAVRKLLRTFSLPQILDAIPIAGQYLKLDADGKATKESFEHAFAKVGGIARLASMPKDERQLYYIRGICRQRFEYCVEWQCLSLLRDAAALGVSADYLTTLAKDARSWTQWRNWMYEVLNEARDAAKDAGGES